jgi:hypothetical protein
VPLHRRLLEGLLRHCLADRWLQAEGAEQGERQMEGVLGLLRAALLCQGEVR